MDQVFAKTRELGQAILESELYAKMKEAEERAMANAEAAAHMARYLEIRGEIEKMLAGESPDSEVLKRMSDEMDGEQEALNAIGDVQALTAARNDFSSLIEQVNQVLRFIITGEMPGEDEEEGGCGGSCESCGGGCHGHHLN